MSLSTDPLYNCMTIESTMVNMLGWIFSTYLSWPRKELAILVQIQASSFTIILTKFFCSDSVKKDVNDLNFYTHFFLHCISICKLWISPYIAVFFFCTSITISVFISCISFRCCLCPPCLKSCCFSFNLFSPEP